MDKPMKTMENSIETIEKKTWNQSKNWWTMRMRDFSYKMQQMSDFSFKNQRREPGRPKKKQKKNPKQNAHPFSVQEQPQEVAEVLPAAAKKASKVQLRLCSCRASRIFASFPQSATIRPIYSAFMWFVKQASMAPMFLKVQKEPSVKMEATTAAEACFGMRHDASLCNRFDRALQARWSMW